MTTINRIFVSSVSRVAELVATERPDAILSIGARPTFDEAARPARQLFLDFADIDQPTARNQSLAATAEDIDAIRSLVDCRQVLIHCQQGQRRSPAAALILLHEALGESIQPRLLAEWIWSLADYVDFNHWVLALAGIERSQLGPPRPFNPAPRGAYFVLDLEHRPGIGVPGIRSSVKETGPGR